MEQGGGRESRSRGSGACTTSRTNHNHKGHEGTQSKTTSRPLLLLAVRAGENRDLETKAEERICLWPTAKS